MLETISWEEKNMLWMKSGLWDVNIEDNFYLKALSLIIFNENIK